MSSTLLWFHEDALNLEHPVAHGYDVGEHGVFIWDPAYLQAMNYGFQRLVFIYETVCELGIPIFAGDTLEVLTELARIRGASFVRAPATPNPDLMRLVQDIPPTLPIEWVEDQPFVSLDRPPKLKRFFGYWKKARPLLLRE